MKNSNLAELLRGFSLREMVEFEKFLQSPFFKCKRDVLPMFRIVKKYYPRFENENFTTESIHAALFPGKKYDKRSDGLMRTITSELISQCKEFLAYTDFGKDRNRKKYYLLNHLRQKKLFREFEKEYTKVSEDNGSDINFLEDIGNKSLLASVYKNYCLDKNKFKDAFEATLKIREYSVMTALVNSFMHQDEKTLAFGYNVSVRENIVDDLIRATDLEKLMERMNNTKDKAYTFVYTFYLVYKMNAEGLQENYFKLKEHLETCLHLFSRNDKYLLLSILGTYCSGRTSGSQKELFKQELFYTHKKMIEANAYKTSDKDAMHIVLFRNIVINCRRIKETKWLKEFIEKYSHELQADHRESMTNYSAANLSFAEGNFEQALSDILKIRYDLFLYKIDLKYLQLQIYYELGYYEQAYSLIDTAMHFLKTSTALHERSKAAASNFFRYTKELLRICELQKNKKKEIAHLHKKLTEEKFITNSEWLAEKMQEQLVEE